MASAIAAAAFTARAAHAQDTSACIAASEEATTARREGKLLRARAALSTCSAPSCPELVKASCQQRLEEIRQIVPSIVFQVKDAAGNDLARATVTMDGQPLAGGITTAIELDPGPHAFTFDSEGQPTTRRAFTLVEGARERREVIVMAAPPAPSPADTATGAADHSPHGGGWRPVRTLGIVTGGVGVAGIAVGTVFGLLASSAWNRARSDCGGTTLARCPNHAGAVDEHGTTVTDATISTVGFVAGGALIAGGVALFVLGATPSPEASPRAAATMVLTPVLGPRVVGLSFERGF